MYYKDFETNTLTFYGLADTVHAKDFSIEGAVVPGLLLCSKNKANAQEQPGYKLRLGLLKSRCRHFTYVLIVFPYF